MTILRPTSFQIPGLRRDDDFEADIFSNVIPAQAGIQRLS
jgi:hypothetical protein